MTGVRDEDKSLLSQAPGLDIRVGSGALPWDGDTEQEARKGNASCPCFSVGRGRGQRLAASPAGSPAGQARGCQRAPRSRPLAGSAALQGWAAIVFESHCWEVVCMDSQVCN